MYHSISRNIRKIARSGNTRAMVIRGMSLYRLLDKIYYSLSDSQYFMDVLIEGQSLMVMFSDRSVNLYVAPVIISGDDVTIGEPQRVTEGYDTIPENTRGQIRGTISVTRQSNGSYRWLMRAGVAVLNRVSEIDSTALFDEFVSRFQAGAYDPYLTFRHMPKDGFYMGDVDLVARDGYILVTSGTFDVDPENELARAMAESLIRDAGYWGVSIGYRLEADDPPPEIITYNLRSGDITIELDIPVYNNGTLIECSILAEADCASHFTDVMNIEGAIMPTNKRSLRDDLLVAFNGNDTQVDSFLEGNDSLNRQINAEGLITRDDETETDDTLLEADTNTETEQPTGADPETVDVELDDELTAEIVAGLSSNADFVSAVAGAVGSSETDGESVGELRSLVATLLVRVNELEQENEQLADVLEADTPRRSLRLSRSGSRPSERHKDDKKRNKPTDKSEINSEIDEMLNGLTAEIPD